MHLFCFIRLFWNQTLNKMTFPAVHFHNYLPWLCPQAIPIQLPIPLDESTVFNFNLFKSTEYLIGSPLIHNFLDWIPVQAIEFVLGWMQFYIVALRPHLPRNPLNLKFYFIFSNFSDIIPFPFTFSITK